MADVGRGRQPGHDAGVPRRLPGDRGLDLPHRLPLEGLSLTPCFAAIPNGKPAFTFAGIALWRPRIRALIISGRFRFGRRRPAEEQSLSMARIVMKFGGTSVADISRIRNVARHVKREVDAGNEVAVVVSAMSGQDQRARRLDPRDRAMHDAREYDTVVAAGEQITSGLLAIALQTARASRPAPGKAGSCRSGPTAPMAPHASPKSAATS